MYLRIKIHSVNFECYYANVITKTNKLLTHTGCHLNVALFALKCQRCLKFGTQSLFTSLV